jgi:DNA processing protein
MSKAEYWIWLSAALGAGARVDEITEAYPDPEILYHESRRERAVSGVFSKQRLDRLESTPLENALTAAEVCRKNGWEIITPDSEDFPPDLKNLPDMPLVLFAHGDISCLKDNICVGVVGTREPTYDSVEIAKSLSRDMAACGAVIVSGGALGIDTAAHEGALEAGGKTVCVLGCGLGTRYLMQNSTLREEIAKNGAVISEYLPFSPASARTFPIRNRIISGLSKGVLVVEAGEKSGSLITAKCALDQGREVFAVPGSILSSAYTGANRLIRDGAKAVTCAKDILEPFDFAFPGRLSLSENKNKLPAGKPRRGDKKINSRKSLPPDYGENEKAVYALLTNEPLHSDEICALTGLSPSKVISALTELEIGGYAEQTEGRNYILS